MSKFNLKLKTEVLLKCIFFILKRIFLNKYFVLNENVYLH